MVLMQVINERRAWHWTMVGIILTGAIGGLLILWLT